MIKRKQKQSLVDDLKKLLSVKEEQHYTYKYESGFIYRDSTYDMNWKKEDLLSGTVNIYKELAELFNKWTAQGYDICSYSFGAVEYLTEKDIKEYPGYCNHRTKPCERVLVYLLLKK